MITQPSGASDSQQITPVPSTSRVLTPPKPSPLQGSSVSKCLFNPAPQTPSPSTTDKSVSPADNQTQPSMNKKTVSPQQQFTSTNRTVITSETIQVSPMKQVSYYSIERNHFISSPLKSTTSKRFSTAKGRLNFDGSEMTASDVPTFLSKMVCLTWFLTVVAGPNSVTSMKSVTKCVKVFSPVKSRKSTKSSYET